MHHEKLVSHQMANAKAQAAWDIATLQALECRTLFVVANRTVIAKMFLSLVLVNNFYDAVVDKRVIVILRP